MSPALPSVTGREVVKALASAGFQQVSVKGSHLKLAHPDGRRTVVPMHGGRDIPRGTVASILRRSGSLPGREVPPV
jgi:predicted RNA binding protein YcfA (HicA-like mRNA interferase family)